MVRSVLSVQAGTIWSGRWYVVRSVMFGQVGTFVQAGTMWSGRYFLFRLVLCGQVGTLFSGRVLCGQSDTMWSGLYFMFRPVLCGQAGYCLIRPVTDYVVRAGTFCSGRVLCGQSDTIWSGVGGTMWSNRYWSAGSGAILCDRDS